MHLRVGESVGMEKHRKLVALERARGEDIAELVDKFTHRPRLVPQRDSSLACERLALASRLTLLVAAAV
jgi:hypothetical protein